MFGRKKQAHRREATEQFVVRPSPSVEGEEGPLDEAAVLRRAVAYFQETRQVGESGRERTITINKMRQLEQHTITPLTHPPTHSKTTTTPTYQP